MTLHPLLNGIQPLLDILKPVIHLVKLHTELIDCLKYIGRLVWLIVNAEKSHNDSLVSALFGCDLDCWRRFVTAELVITFFTIFVPCWCGCFAAVAAFLLASGWCGVLLRSQSVVYKRK
jgi:hypothetical protein